MLIDVFAADAEFGPASREALRRCIAEGSLVACDVVWAEVAAGFDDPGAADQALTRLGVRFVPLDAQMALAAGSTWRSSRRRAPTRQRVIADFLIGTHAAQAADRLLTRDRGFYSSHFQSLEIVNPSPRRTQSGR